jgi:hypothetical protein
MVPWEGGEMRRVSWDREGGPLAAFADGYRGDLAGLGFTANSVVTHVVLMGQLSRWMAQAGVRVDELTPARIDEFSTAVGLAGREGSRRLGPWLLCSLV